MEIQLIFYAQNDTSENPRTTELNNNNMNKDFMYGTASEYVCKYTWRSAL